MNEELDTQPQKFWNDWDNCSTIEQVAASFGRNNDHLASLGGAEVVHADYTYVDYSGSAYLLYRQDGKFFEVSGSHCSCYGLEESDWDPEEVPLEALVHRYVNNPNFPAKATRYYTANPADTALKKAIETLMSPADAAVSE